MKWLELLERLQGQTVFDSSMLLSGKESPSEVGRQLSRWVVSGRLIQLRRGLYVVAPPFAGSIPSALAIACRLRRPSYVSLQSALSFHGVIPEAVPVVTCVTTRRPGRFETPLGEFQYRHVKPGLFWGYEEVDAGPGQTAFVAGAEKALLDLCHLTAGEIDAAFLDELRLDPDQIDPLRLRQFAERTGKPKLIRAAGKAARILEEEISTVASP